MTEGVFITPGSGSQPPWTPSFSSESIVIPFRDAETGDDRIIEIGVNSDWYTDPQNLNDQVHWGIAYDSDDILYLCVRVDQQMRVGASLRQVVWNADGTVYQNNSSFGSYYTRILYPGYFYYWTRVNTDEFAYTYPVTATSAALQNYWNQSSTWKPIFIVEAGSLVAHVGWPTPEGSFTSEAVPLYDQLEVNGSVYNDYNYGSTSGSGGGVGGSFDNSSDSVDFASLPTGGAAASGLITMFAPTAAQLADFGVFLWTTLFDGGFDSLLTSLKKWVNDPIESVIQLSAFPVTPPAGAAQMLKFCGIRSDLVGSGVQMNKCTSQFMDFDFGQITTPAYWKQTLDYSPYTQVSIYLPYIGICPLKSDDVIDATLHLKYHIDLLTGGFSAELKCSKTIDGTPLDSVLYNWSGNMSTQIPITSSNFSQVFGSMMTAVAAIGVGAVTGGMGAAAAGTGEAAASSSAIAGGALSGAGHGLAANIGNVINSKPHVTQSGRLDGTVGALSQFTPYLIIERPVQSLSAKFKEEQGYPSNTVQTLGNLSGLTVCEAPIMTGFSGVNEDELREIKQLLTTGVIL